ncbi:hypothetical protein PhaeoP75_00368 [Phaeobacter gallaeciensis]|uniref:Uncharacterized protein n=1 Tax=Phaeobacter gallaeciensis TaxID=60890 RepID=A0AAC9Z612_9RHOB|nr:hypothetical protein Gal_00370 [Phaeobacter gallaeciensis DSM 26640]ATE91432.1 hypothetical protein PhaeoP11_00367 [Phaeobacter gallaeciensis]ATE95708.1 hypothetical protein PhaeoP73_00368 [Phaeobacter gallaeciensis]ATF00048.1 hypothetical protein PhaeoP75_00368 [Phaeobacter gallaeciensis]ATF04480.1 hypothetical protein PhaeoP63_00368 [Phaeobacter gallaeciensis]
MITNREDLRIISPRLEDSCVNFQMLRRIRDPLAGALSYTRAELDFF